MFPFRLSYTLSYRSFLYWLTTGGTIIRLPSHRTRLFPPRYLPAQHNRLPISLDKARLKNDRINSIQVLQSLCVLSLTLQKKKSTDLLRDYICDSLYLKLTEEIHGSASFVKSCYLHSYSRISQQVIGSIELVPFLDHMNPIHNTPFYFLEIHFNNILASTSNFPSGSFLMAFRPKCCMH